ncbi:ras-related protein Rab-40C isoform X1 [Elephas maximus indicus]|nr:ras-related protein Rab-40C isoform X1 [Elephas maximus indicus]XP_049759350.1 ras-related protein Rab-40C isoform X1 [Elephas maximus indicus]
MVTARRRATGGSAALCGKLRRLCARDGRASGPMAAGGSQWLPGRPGAGPPRSVRHPSAGSPGSARGACGPGLRAHERRMGTQGSPVKSYDYLLKFLLVGDSDVGKGEILESLQDGASESPYAYSNGIDYKTTTILLDGRRVKLELWDTSGQGRFCTIFRSYSRGAQGILLVYDITNRWSFDGIDRWIKEIDEHAPGVPRILVGNRLHLAFKRQVPTEQARAYAEKNCMTFFEVSPLCNFNVTESFTELSRIVLMRHGMEKIWRPNRVFSLQDLCCRAIVSCTPVHLIDKLPLPVTIKSHLKSFSMANGMNAVMMHGRSYSLAGGGGGGGSKGNSLKRSRCIRPPQSPPQNCSRSNCKIS